MTMAAAGGDCSTRSWNSVCTRIRRAPSLCGCSFSIPAAIIPMSARACSRLTPGLSRPRTESQATSRRCKSFCPSRGAMASGRYTAGRPSMPVKAAGATPMTVSSIPFNRIREPRTDGLAPNWLTQKSWLSTATGSRPSAWSSSARNPRPSAGSTPSTRKKLLETNWPSLTRGNIPARGLKPSVAVEAATSPSKLRLRSRKSA